MSGAAASVHVGRGGTSLVDGGTITIQTLELTVARVSHHLVLRVRRLRHKFVLGCASSILLNDTLELIIHVAVDGLRANVSICNLLLMIFNDVLALVSAHIIVVVHQVTLRVTNSGRRLLAGALRDQACLKAETTLARRVVRGEVHLLLGLHVALK